MELTYNELKQRDVINIVDGRCFGKISDATFSFPEGKIVGITVPGKKENWFIRIFSKSKVYISRKNIVKIGGDVILVKLNCGDTCSESTSANPPKPPSPCGCVGATDPDYTDY